MTADERAIRLLISTWLAASKAGDTQKVLSLMSDDALFLVAGHPPMRGKAAFAASLQALADVSIDAASDVQEVRAFGDWAYAWTNLAITVTPRTGGQPLRRAGSTLTVYRKEHGAWVLFRDANLLAPVEADQ